jgi:hypothetical protein
MSWDAYLELPLVRRVQMHLSIGNLIEKENSEPAVRPED